MYPWNFALFTIGCILPVCLTEFCGAKQNITYAKIPDTNIVLTIEEFEKHVVNNKLPRMYVGVSEPATNHDINSYSTISKNQAPSDYSLKKIGETPDINRKCASSEIELTPKTDDGAIFADKNTLDMYAYWSRCPQQYIWSMKCANHYIGTKCVLPHVTLELYVTRETLHDMPMTDIAEDLCGATGVKLGVTNFRWFFTFGKNTKC